MNPPNYVALDFSDPTDLSQLYPQSRREFLKQVAHHHMPVVPVQRQQKTRHTATAQRAICVHAASRSWGDGSGLGVGNRREEVCSTGGRSGSGEDER